MKTGSGEQHISPHGGGGGGGLEPPAAATAPPPRAPRGGGGGRRVSPAAASLSVPVAAADEGPAPFSLAAACRVAPNTSLSSWALCMQTCLFDNLKWS